MKNEKNTAQLSGWVKTSIAVGAAVTLVKFVSGLLTNSLAVMASALHSAMGVAVSAGYYTAVVEKADGASGGERAGGYGKLESLVGLTQGFLIGCVGLYLVYEAAQRLTLGSAVKNVSAGVVAMVFSMTAAGVLASRMKRTAKTGGGIILSSIGSCFSKDVFWSFAVMSALVLIRMTHYVFWDWGVSLVLTGYVLKTAHDMLRRSIDELLDRSLAPPLQREIKELIIQHDPAVGGIQRFRSRQTGGKISLNVDINLQVEDDFKRARAITEALAEKIRKKCPGADVWIGFAAQGEEGRVEHAGSVGRG